MTELKGTTTKIQVDLQSGMELLKTDFTQKLSVVETKTDHCTALQERTLALLDTKAPSNHSQAQPMYQDSSQNRNRHCQGSYVSQYGKGGQYGKGAPTRTCYGCGGKGHIVRNCPNIPWNKGKGFSTMRCTDGGQVSINAIAMDLVAAVSSYDRGGLGDLPVGHLHEQMGDTDVQMSQADVCHLALEFASDLMDSSECNECEPAAATGVRQTQQLAQVHMNSEEPRARHSAEVQPAVKRPQSGPVQSVIQPQTHILQQPQTQPQLQSHLLIQPDNKHDARRKDGSRGELAELYRQQHKGKGGAGNRQSKPGRENLYRNRSAVLRWLRVVNSMQWQASDRVVLQTLTDSALPFRDAVGASPMEEGRCGTAVAVGAVVFEEGCIQTQDEMTTEPPEVAEAEPEEAAEKAAVEPVGLEEAAGPPQNPVESDDYPDSIFGVDSEVLRHRPECGPKSAKPAQVLRVNKISYPVEGFLHTALRSEALAAHMEIVKNDGGLL